MICEVDILCHRIGKLLTLGLTTKLCIGSIQIRNLRRAWVHCAYIRWWGNSDGSGSVHRHYEILFAMISALMGSNPSIPQRLVEEDKRRVLFTVMLWIHKMGRFEEKTSKTLGLPSYIQASKSLKAPKLEKVKCYDHLFCNCCNIDIRSECKSIGTQDIECWHTRGEMRVWYGKSVGTVGYNNLLILHPYCTE